MPTSSTSRSRRTSVCCWSRRRRRTTIGKFANGIADDFLSSLFLATAAPVLVAPAMNTNMLANPAVQQNLATLQSRGVRFVDPGEGYLACGWIGKGRLAEPADVARAAHLVLSRATVTHWSSCRRDGGPDLRGSRSGALRGQSLQRQDGVCNCRGAGESRGECDADHRTDVAEPSAGGIGRARPYRGADAPSRDRCPARHRRADHGRCRCQLQRPRQLPGRRSRMMMVR